MHGDAHALLAGPAAVAAAEAFHAPGAWIPHLALAEAMWVLESVYALKPARIATAERMFQPTTRPATA